MKPTPDFTPSKPRWTDALSFVRRRAIPFTAAGMMLVGCSAVAGSATAAPSFTTYPAKERFRGTPAAPRFGDLPIRNAHKPIIGETVRRGPNFAGAYTVVTYGCGTGCQVVLVVSARTGKVVAAPMAASYGVSFRRSSRLLVFNADPVNGTKAKYFVFNRGKFRAVR